MEKEEIIRKIKTIIENWGSFTTADVEAECSPVINSMGKDNFQLAERFDSDGVTAVTYVHDNEVDEEEIDYEDLAEDVLDEILVLAENFAIDMDKTMESCRN